MDRSTHVRVLSLVFLVSCSLYLSTRYLNADDCSSEYVRGGGGLFGCQGGVECGGTGSEGEGDGTDGEVICDAGATSGIGSVAAASGNVASLSVGDSETAGSFSPNVTFAVTSGGAILVRVAGVNLSGTVVKPSITNVRILAGSTLPTLGAAKAQSSTDSCAAAEVLGCEDVVDLGSSAATQIDVGVLLDTTGSMGGAVQTMADEITTFVNALGSSGLDIAFGCATFGDAFATSFSTPYCDDGGSCSSGLCEDGEVCSPVGSICPSDGSTCSGTCDDGTPCPTIGAACESDGSTCSNLCGDGNWCETGVFTNSSLVEGTLGIPPDFDWDERPDCGLTPLSSANAAAFWTQINAGLDGIGTGGNDLPENSLGVLDWFAKNFEWRDGSQRQVVLITDACSQTTASNTDGITGPLDHWMPPEYTNLRTTLTTGTPVTVNVIGGEELDCASGDPATQDPLQLATDTGGQQKTFSDCSTADSCPIDLTSDIPLSGVLVSTQSTSCSYTALITDPTFVVIVDVSATPASGGAAVTGQFLGVLTATLR